MSLLRLSGRKVCERVKSKGLLWKGKHLHARYLKGMPRNVSQDALHGIRVGVVTSAKLDKSAVKRNRMRRRCREALRILSKEQQAAPLPDVQLLLLPRSSSLTAPFEELLADTRRLLFSLRA